jgi:hypothetical protein
VFGRVRYNRVIVIRTFCLATTSAKAGALRQRGLGGDMSQLRVAVRCRPFNSREKKGRMPCVVSMNGKQLDYLPQLHGALTVWFT